MKKGLSLEECKEKGLGYYIYRNDWYNYEKNDKYTLCKKNGEIVIEDVNECYISINGWCEYGINDIYTLLKNDRDNHYGYNKDGKIYEKNLDEVSMTKEELTCLIKKEFMTEPGVLDVSGLNFGEYVINFSYISAKAIYNHKQQAGFMIDNSSQLSDEINNDNQIERKKFKNKELRICNKCEEVRTCSTLDYKDWYCEKCKKERKEKVMNKRKFDESPYYKWYDLKPTKCQKEWLDLCISKVYDDVLLYSYVGGGKSWISNVLAHEWAIGAPNSNILIISQQSHMIDCFQDMFARKICHESSWELNKESNTIRFVTNSTIKFRSPDDFNTKMETDESDKYNLIIIDDANNIDKSSIINIKELIKQGQDKLFVLNGCFAGMSGQYLKDIYKDCTDNGKIFGKTIFVDGKIIGCYKLTCENPYLSKEYTEHLKEHFKRMEKEKNKELIKLLENEWDGYNKLWLIHIKNWFKFCEESKITGESMRTKDWDLNQHYAFKWDNFKNWDLTIPEEAKCECNKYVQYFIYLNNSIKDLWRVKHTLKYDDKFTFKEYEDNSKSSALCHGTYVKNK